MSEKSVSDLPESIEDDVKTVASRRKLLKGVIAGGAFGGAATLPASWKRPVIGSSVLPAHATATTEPFASTGVVGRTVISVTEQSFENFVSNVMSAVVPTAQAGGICTPSAEDFCITITVENLLDDNSQATVELSSNEFGDGDEATGTYGALKSGGLLTGNGYRVVVNSLVPPSGGSGTVNGIPFTLDGGNCEPADPGDECGPISK